MQLFCMHATTYIFHQISQSVYIKCAIVKVFAAKHYRDGTTNPNPTYTFFYYFLVAWGGMNQWCVWTHLGMRAYFLTLRKLKTENKQRAGIKISLPTAHLACFLLVLGCDAAIVCVCGDVFPTAPRLKSTRLRGTQNGAHTHTHTCINPDMEVMQSQFSGNVRHDITWNAAVWKGSYSKFQDLYQLFLFYVNDFVCLNSLRSKRESRTGNEMVTENSCFFDNAEMSFQYNSRKPNSKFLFIILPAVRDKSS